MIIIFLNNLNYQIYSYVLDLHANEKTPNYNSKWFSRISTIKLVNKKKNQKYFLFYLLEKKLILKFKNFVRKIRLITQFIQTLR